MIVCVPSRSMRLGGPSVFVQKFRMGLEERGVRVNTDPTQRHDILFVLSSLPFSMIRRSKSQGAKVVQRLDSVYYYRVRGVLYPLWNYRMKIIHRSLADFVVYQGENCKHVCTVFLGPTRAPWSIVPNGTDLTRYTPLGEKKNLRDVSEQKVILSVGVFRREEMIMPIIRAADLLYRQGASYKLVIIGSLAPKIERAVAPFQSHPAICFLGKIPNDELPIYERSADLYAFSDVACSPNVLMEALSSGLPVVTFDRGGISELIDDSCGAVIPHRQNEFWRIAPFDIAAFAKGIERVADHLQIFQKAARRRAEERCSLDMMVYRYLEVFERIL